MPQATFDMALGTEKVLLFYKARKTECKLLPEMEERLICPGSFSSLTLPRQVFMAASLYFLEQKANTNV